MDLRKTQFLAILIFCHQVTWGAGEQITVKEGNNVEIKCKPGVSNRPSTIWFRVRDNAGMEFMATYDLNGNQKKKSSTLQLDSSKITRDILILESFKREDSGFYCCAVIQGYSLEFGQVTQLVAETIAAPQPTVAATTRETKCTTAAVCVCEEKGKTVKGMSLDCAPLILGPLAGGCGLLLLLLIITSLYCNKIRTRRCPHHHKRKPRTMPGGTKGRSAHSFSPNGAV